MKKFRITVNGTSYEVEVEEIGGMLSAAPSATVRPVPVVAPVPGTITTAAPGKPSPVIAEPIVAPSAPKSTPRPVAVDKPLIIKGEVVKSPMPGTILEIKVNLGEEVKEGDTLLVLEAMKMENEIYAPSTGRINEISVNKGDSVNSGDVLVVIGE